MSTPDSVRIGVIGTGYLGAFHAMCMTGVSPSWGFAFKPGSDDIRNSPAQRR